MPLSNAYSRRRELKADEYAVRATGAAGPLVSALEKLASQNLADKNPAPWIEAFCTATPPLATASAPPGPSRQACGRASAPWDDTTIMN
jgi:Zn-dependent protease with chaperone function